jgi:hypothetical protein
MRPGETVVFVKDVEDVEAGKHGRLIGVTEDGVMVACRVREKLKCVLVQAWDVLSEEMWRRLMKRRQIVEWEKYRGQGDVQDARTSPPALNCTAKAPIQAEDDTLQAWLDRAQKARERMAIEETYRKEVPRGIS